MTGLDFLDLGKESLWIVLLLSGPLLFTSLVIGFLISLIQALTQIQEMSLTFVPKICGVLFVFFMLLPTMSKVLESFTLRLFDHISVIEGVQ